MSSVRRRRRGVAAVLLSAVLGSSAVLVPHAGADEIADKKAQAEALAGKIEALNHEIEKFAEAANGAEYELSQLTGKLGEVQQRVDRAKAEYYQRRIELKSYAIAAYVRGEQDSQRELIDRAQAVGGNGEAAAYLSAVSGDRQRAIDELRAAREDLDAEVAQLDKAKAEAQGRADELNQQRAAAQAAAAEQDRLYDQVQGELATLVQEAQARQEAERAARAQQRAQQEQQRQQQQPRQQPQPSPRAPTAPPPDNSSPAPPPSSGRDVSAVLAEARRQLGKPYVWGAAGPDAFDCSGFTKWAWRAGGVSLPHYTVAQYNATTHVPMSAIEPGDLIFYGSGLGHNAIYLGNGQIIHAPNSRSVVRIDSLYYWDVPMVASRP